jgi:hypothetical protein
MITNWVRRIALDGSGTWMFWLAARSYAREGWVEDTTFLGCMGGLMIVMAISAKGT